MSASSVYNIVRPYLVKQMVRPGTKTMLLLCFVLVIFNNYTVHPIEWHFRNINMCSQLKNIYYRHSYDLEQSKPFEKKWTVRQWFQRRKLIYLILQLICRFTILSNFYDNLILTIEYYFITNVTALEFNIRPYKLVNWSKFWPQNI